MSPSSPRGWLSWAVSVKDSYHRAHSANYDDSPRRDRRLNYSRETAISIIRMCEKSANGKAAARGCCTPTSSRMPPGVDLRNTSSG
jgi:hypothetical protein